MIGTSIGQAFAQGVQGYRTAQQDTQSQEEALDNRRLKAQQLKTSIQQERMYTSQADTAQAKADQVVRYITEQNELSDAKVIMNNTIRNIDKVYTDNLPDYLNSSRVVEAYNSARSKNKRLQQVNPPIRELSISNSGIKLIDEYLLSIGVEPETIAELKTSKPIKLTEDSITIAKQDKDPNSTQVPTSEFTYDELTTQPSFYELFAQSGSYVEAYDPETGNSQGIYEVPTLLSAMDQYQSFSDESKLALSNTIKAISGQLQQANQRTRKPTTVEEREFMFNDMKRIEAIPLKNRTQQDQDNLQRYKLELTKAYDTAQQRNTASDTKLNNEVLSVATSTDMGSVNEPMDTKTASAIEARTRASKIYKQQGLDKAEATLSMYSNIIPRVETLAKDLEGMINDGTYKSGVYDKLESAFGNLRGRNDWTTYTAQAVLEKAGMDSRISMLVADVLKEMSGASATDDEYKRLLTAVAGTPNEQAPVRLKRIQTYVDGLREHRDILGNEVRRYLPLTYKQSGARPLKPNRVKVTPSSKSSDDYIKQLAGMK